MTDAMIDLLRSRTTVSVDTAARALSISRSSAYAAVRDKELPSIRVAGRLVVPTGQLLRLLGEDWA